MPRSLYEPELFLKVINTKKRQLAEIEGDLQRLPDGHPTRPRWLERMWHLQQGIPALEAEYVRRTGEPVAKDKAPVSSLRASVGARQSAAVTRSPQTRKRSNNKRKSFVQPLLEEKGWSTKDWAVHSAVDFHTADRYLKGEKSYRSTRKKLADSLGVVVEDLPR